MIELKICLERGRNETFVNLKYGGLERQGNTVERDKEWSQKMIIVRDRVARLQNCPNIGKTQAN